MSELKEYLDLKQTRSNLISRIQKLENDISRLNEEMGPLEEEALKAEILKVADFEKKKIAVSESKDRITNLKAEVEEARKKIKIMDSLLPQFREKAWKELAAQYKKIFEKAVKPFVMKLEAAHESELELEKIRKDAEAEFTKNDLGPCPIENWRLIVAQIRGYAEAKSITVSSILSEWEEMIKRWKNQGYDF